MMNKYTFSWFNNNLIKIIIIQKIEIKIKLKKLKQILKQTSFLKEKYQWKPKLKKSHSQKDNGILHLLMKHKVLHTIYLFNIRIMCQYLIKLYSIQGDYNTLKEKVDIVVIRQNFSLYLSKINVLEERVEQQRKQKKYVPIKQHIYIPEKLNKY
ncbi:unnamed protein product [Paramecium sonneborni]|uniref:Uncharacterized protein n=1 Tax=Paramecium sonneborni TaxID=65129 RepID=A0A8S1Q1H6_9CILI|nr:unnamed protein product [Paramecium sonneborni]